MEGSDHCHNAPVQYLFGGTKENHKKISVTIITSWANSETWNHASTSPTSYIRTNKKVDKIYMEHPYISNNAVYLRLFWTCSSSISSRSMLQISASVSKWFIWMMNGRRISYKVVQRPSRYDLKQNRNRVNPYLRFAADLDTNQAKS